MFFFLCVAYILDLNGGNLMEFDLLKGFLWANRILIYFLNYAHIASFPTDE